MIEKWLAGLEAKFGKYAIPGLVRMLVMLNGFVYLLLLLNPEFMSALTFHPRLILQGQVWRMVTFLFLPETMQPFFLIIALYFLWMIGDGLEEAWGAFRLNLFYGIGVLATVAAAFLFGSGASSFYLNTVLFLAFTTLFPNFTILLFFVLPIAVKWLGLLSFSLLLYDLFAGPMPVKAAVVAAFIGYILFFAPFFLERWQNSATVAARRARFDMGRDSSETLHCCAICSATEESDPERDFRVTADGSEICSVCREQGLKSVAQVS
jgi:hypothetical protein